MVATTKFVREAKAGGFEFRAAGTASPERAFVPQQRRPEYREYGRDPARRWRVCAGEGGSAFEIDPETLASRGPVTWRNELVAAPFSAHPQLDRDGTPGTSEHSFLRWLGSVDLAHRRGRNASTRRLLDCAPGYLHASR